MSFSITYHPLCSFQCYHNYFLDDGETAFDDPLFPDLKEEQIAKYNIDSFIKIVPTQETAKILQGQKIVFRKTNTGFAIFIYAVDTATPGKFSPFIKLDQDQQLQFLIYITDPLFENYSTIGANPTLPYYFSNNRLFSEANDFPLIASEGETQEPIASYQITEDSYEHISEEFSFKEKEQLFGVISLNIKSLDPTKSLLDNNGDTLVPPPQFKIQFKNRETFWQYLDAKDGSFLHKTPTAKPLVKNGVIPYTFDGKRRPSAAPNRLLFVKDGNGTIIETISEIFI